MKLLIYSSSFFPAIGGTERVTLDLARGIAEWPRNEANGESFDVTVATETAGVTAEDEGLPFSIVRGPSLPRLFSLMRAADVIHLAGPAMAPLALGLMAARPVVVEHHGFQTVCPNGQYFYAPGRKLCDGYYMSGKLGKCVTCNSGDAGALASFKLLFSTPFRRWLSNRAAVNITPTDWLASVLKLHRMKTVCHGILPLGEMRNTKAPVHTFAFQGRLVSTKGASVLIDAAMQLQKRGAKFAIKIIGDGPERERLTKQAQPLGSAVEFLGAVPDQRLAEIYSEVSVVVVASLAGEVFGLVAAENMWRGKATIVSDLGSLKEVVGETAIVVPAGDASALADSMYRAMEEPCRVSSMGKAARERAAKIFDVEAMIRSHISIYRECVQ
ncbi:MAG TPA: glycosyltransferase family 4 protein [Candidatus Aquilonibacter sp.]|nr:glycosyltransferase family 4 protein [Candidatus Aquilonibacter sp.]